MGEGIAHMISPLTAPWCGWTMLVLMLFAILSEWLQPGVISQATASLTVRMERTYKEAPTNFLAQTLITLFRLGTLALGLCLCFGLDGHFSFVGFIAVCSIIFGVTLVKMLCNVLVDYTFQLSRVYGDAYEHYSNIFTLAMVALYPLLLIFLHIGSQAATRWLMGIMAVLFFVLWLYRSARQYIRTPQAILYLLIYMLTLEFLPMAGIIVLSAKTISNI